MPNIRISEAAELLAVSDDTVRRWIETGKLAASTDDSNRQVIDGVALANFAVEQAKSLAASRADSISARNRFVGIVTKIQIEGLVAQVEVQSGANHFVSLITSDAARALHLEVGSKTVVSIKSTNVGIETE
jgi:molybdopterin-binding protein